MKAIIAGSRNFDDYNLLEQTVRNWFREHNLHRTDVEIVSGTAKGADRLGEQFANKFGLKLTKFPADWNQYGKSAGYRRNLEMAKYADMVFIFWDGQSRGTKMMIDLAKQYNLEIIITKYT